MIWLNRSVLEALRVISDDLFNRDCIILDACCIINLYATRRMQDILQAIPPSVAVATYVHDTEATRIYGGPSDDPTSIIEVVDLQPLIDLGLLLLVEPETEAEENALVNVAASLDIGEAITGAIASQRKWAIGTDDRKAVSFFTRIVPQSPVITTPQLIKHWADTSEATARAISDVLTNVRLRARYQPGRGHDLYCWWQRYPSEP